MQNNVAYMNYDDIKIPPQHNREKWLTAVKDIYSKQQDSISRIEAIRNVTKGWKITEIYDFLNWLRYYEQGSHLKYKFSQLWFDNDAPNRFTKPVVQNQSTHVDEVNKTVDISSEEKKRLVEKQKNKIIGRLDSLEKLIRSPDGQSFSDTEFESLMKSIIDLKQKIYLLNKKSLSTTIYDDLIIRQANILKRDSFYKAAEFLVLAVDKMPEPSQATSPIENVGYPGGLPSMGPGMPQNPPDSAPNNNPNSKGLSDFISNLNTAKITTEEDSNEADDYDLFVSEAQAIEPTTSVAPQVSNTPVAQNQPQVTQESVVSEKPGLDVSPQDIKPELSVEETPEQSVNKFDNAIDQVLSNITVNDAINKLEDVSKIFKVREIPRQLGIVDMMLDALGLSPFFPSLSEATNKALESNNYISSRIDDILSKLKGSTEAKDVDLRGDEKVTSPNAEISKQNLQSQEDKEALKKKVRKEQEDKAFEPKPEIIVEEPVMEAPQPTAPITPPAQAPTK